MADNEKFHLSLNVSDLDRAVEFYGRAFGMAPAKHFPDYAKFEVASPPLVLSLEPERTPERERLNHFGVRLANGTLLRDVAARIHSSGLEPQYIQGVECCYSRQTKICLNDPDGNLVEFYTVDEDLDHRRDEAPRAAAATATPKAGATTAWDHLLGTPFPPTIPASDGSLDEVRLRGTFNVPVPTAERAAILGEARRVLRPGGKIILHLLTADREVTKKLPRLPGPAALVECAPLQSDVIGAVEASGFTALHLERLSHSAVFQFDGAEMRELMLTATKRAAAAASGEKRVVYKGPFPEIRDEDGNRYARGIATPVNETTFALLGLPAYRESFVFLNAPEAGACMTK